MIRAVLFDLDGTLLLHDFDQFQERYFRTLARYLFERTGKDVSQALVAAIAPMLAGGEGTNVERFVQALCAQSGLPRQGLEELVAPYYAHEFPKLGAGMSGDPAARAVVEACRRKGLKTVLATNPVFLEVAILERLRWSGLDASHFDLVTHGEDFACCKPSRSYYRQIAERIAVAPEDCLVVGNDVKLDLAPAAALGMKTFLVANAHRVLNVEGFVPDHDAPLATVSALV